MSWAVVAKKDFQDAIRSKLLWVLSVLFALLSVGIGAAYGSLDALSGGDPSAEGLLYFVASSLGLFVTIAAIVVCHRSIAGERESGSIKLLLSLPHSRFDVLVGKFVGRTGVLAVPILGTLLLGIAVGSALAGVFSVVTTVQVTLITLLFVAAYAGVFLGISALTGSTTFATAVSVVFFVVFEVLWSLVLLLLRLATNGFDFQAAITSAPPEWYSVLVKVPPSSAFEAALNTAVSTPTNVGEAGGGAAQGLSQSPALGFLFLGFWLVVPLVIGYVRFRRTDL